MKWPIMTLLRSHLKYSEHYSNIWELDFLSEYEKITSSIFVDLYDLLGHFQV